MIRLAGSAMLALLAACASSPEFVSSPLPAPQATAEVLSLVPGDVVEVNFFPTGAHTAAAYRVMAGDLLRIDVADHPELTRERVLVLSDGTITVPAAPQLAVAGATLAEIGAELAQHYRRVYVRDPQVVVSVEQGDSRLRSLINRRGLAGSSETYLHEISPSGWLSLPVIAPVDARRPLEQVREDIVRAYREQFGDQLEITLNLRQSKPRTVHVIGEVAKPGDVEYRTRLNALAAVASAGGFLSTAHTSRVVLFRYHPDGSHSQWLLDLDRALARAEQVNARIAVRPDDVIFVPKTGVALANDAVEQYVRRMIPLPVGVGITVQP